MHFVLAGKNAYYVHSFCSSLFSQVADAMKRMHDRQNIGKVILLPEAKEEEEQPKTNPDLGKEEEKTEPVVTKETEEATEEVKAEKD